ncbi:MAG: transcription antitermination factor NusB [Eubacteriales bacterium]
MRHTARNAAVQALLQVEENEGYSNLVLDKVLKAFQLERRDSALTSILFYGVLEKKITLDFYLQHCLKAPEKKMNAAVEMTLRCAAYQILFLDKLPDSAVVNEAVETVKELGKTSVRLCQCMLEHCFRKNYIAHERPVSLSVAILFQPV